MATKEERLPVHESVEIRTLLSRQMVVLRNLDTKRSIFEKVIFFLKNLVEFQLFER